jgi:heme exporter protein D
MTASEFFHMGGYAFFVWSSYGIATVLLGWMFISPIFRRKQIIRELRMKYRQQERQQQDNPAEN